MDGFCKVALATWMLGKKAQCVCTKQGGCVQVTAAQNRKRNDDFWYAASKYASGQCEPNSQECQSPTIAHTGMEFLFLFTRLNVWCRTPTVLAPDISSTAKNSHRIVPSAETFYSLQAQQSRSALVQTGNGVNDVDKCQSIPIE